MSDANQYQVVSSPNYSGPAAALASIFGLNKQQQPQQQQPGQPSAGGQQQQQGSFISQLMQFLQGNGGGMAGGSPMQLGPGSTGSMSGGIGGGGQLLY
jgi:hypothetical protein